MIKPFFIFGIDRTVQNIVGLEQYGHYSVLLSFTYLMQIINDFGIQNFNSRNISQHSHLLEKYFPNILLLKMMLGILCMLLSFGIAILAGWRDYWMLLFLTINQILISLIFFLRSNIAGLAMYRSDSLISVLDKLLMVIFGVVLLWVEPFRSHFQIMWFVYLQTAGLLITAIVAAWIVVGKLKHWRLKFQWPFMLYLLRESFPFALVIFLMTFYTRIDIIMLERLLPDGEKQAGLYASAYRLLDAVNMIGYLFATLLLPMFARLLGKRESVQPLVQLSFQIIMAGAISVAASVWFFKEPLMHLLYDHANIVAAQVLGLLMWSFVAVSGTYIFGTLLTANGDLKGMNYLFTAGIILNIALNYLLIPRYEAVGAAMATCITQFFMMLSQIYLAGRLIRSFLSMSIMLKIIIFNITMLFIAYAASQYLAQQWIWGIVLTLLAGLVLAFVIKLIDISKIRSTLAKG